MANFSRRAGLLLIAILASAAALKRGQAGELSTADLYQSQAIVTGQGEKNRRIGFRECLDDVLVRVSGDQRLLQKPEMPTLRDRAASFVASFRYRDRLEGIPIHDEQGSYDRPHDLYCAFEPALVDKLLASLDSRPWLAARPRLAIFLYAENGQRRFALAGDGPDSRDMRDSFMAAAEPLALEIIFPERSSLAAVGPDGQALRDADMTVLDRAAKEAGGDRALAGSIVWSNENLGWVADWRVVADDQTYQWQIRGVSFDEAFRVAMLGAAQVLSGNGQP